MTGRERVRRALEFDSPDRVPRDLWTLPRAHRVHGEQAITDLTRRWPLDIERALVDNPAFTALTDGDPYCAGRYRDEWGCVFENLTDGIIGQVKQPILDDWSKLEDLRPPVEAMAYSIGQANAWCAATEGFVLADCCPRPFERMQFLRGSEQLFIDLAEEPPELDELSRIVHGFFCDELERWGRTDVDGLMCMDDWGSQRSMLIRPDQWRHRFKPLYQDYCEIAHGAGKKLFMHSDGWIFEIYEDLIEIGVDALNSQLFTMDIEEIGRRFAGRITFWGEIDRQWILPRGTAEQCRAAVQRVADALYRPEGGVIAQFELGSDAPMMNADAVFAAWDELTGGREGG